MEDEIYLVVKSIDLLTAEEVEELPSEIRRIGHWWWIQPMPHFLELAVLAPTVWCSGKINRNRIEDSDDMKVRPALVIENLDELHLPPYTELEIFDENWIYIGNNKVLAKTYLWEGRFDGESNNYAASEIKQKIDAWLEEQKAKYNED